MPRQKEQYVLDIITKVNNAINPLEKIAALLELIGKNEFIDLRIAQQLGDVEKFRQSIKRLAADTVGSESSQKELGKTIASVILTYEHFVKQTAQGSATISTALERPLITSKQILTQFKDLANIQGLDPKRFQSFFDIQADIQKVQQAFTEAQDAIRKYSTTSNEAKEATNRFREAYTQLQANAKQGAIDIANGVGLISEAYSRLLQLSTNPSNTKFSVEALVDLLPSLRTSLSSLNDEMRAIEGRGFSNKGDIERTRELQNQVIQLRGAYQSIFKQLSSETGRNVLAEYFQAGVVSAQEIKRLEQEIENLIISSTGIRERSTTAGSEQLNVLKALAVTENNITEEERKRFERYKEVNDQLKNQRATLEDLKQAATRFTTQPGLDPNNEANIRTTQNYIQKIKETEAIVKDLEREYVSLKNTIGEIPNKVALLVQEMQKARLAGEDLSKFSTRFKEITGQALSGNLNRDLLLLDQESKKATATVGGLGSELDRLNKQNARAANSFYRTRGAIKDFDFFMNIAIEKIIRYRIAFVTMQKAIEAAKKTFTFPKDLESGLTKLAKVLDTTVLGLREVKKEAIDLAIGFGVSVQEVVDTITIFAQQGFTLNESLKLTETVLLGVKAANLEVKDAVEFVTAAIKVYNVEAENTIGLFDKLLNVQRNFAVSTEDLANSVKVLGTTANEFGVSLDSLLGYVTAVGETTRKSGKAVADALKTIFARFVQDDVVEALRKIGVAVFDTEGNVRDLDAVVSDLAVKWDTLSGAQRVNIARLVGGLRRYNDFLVLIEQYDTKLKATIDSQNAFGYTTRAAQTELETLNSALAKVGAAFSAFANNIGSSFLGPFTLIKDLSGAFTELAKGSTNRDGGFFGNAGKGLDFANGAILSFSTSLAGLLIITKSAKLGFGRLAAVVGETRGGMNLLEASFTDANGKLTELGRNGASFEEVLTHLGVSTQNQAKVYQKLGREITKVGDVLTITTHNGYARVILDNNTLTSELRKTGIEMEVAKVNAVKYGKALGGVGKVVGVFRTAMSGLVQTIGKVNIAIGVVLLVLPKLIKMWQDSRKEVKGLTTDLDDNLNKLRGLNDSYKDLTRTTNISVATFKAVSESIKDLDPTDQIIAITKLQNIFEKLAAGNPELENFNLDLLKTQQGRTDALQLLLDNVITTTRDALAIEKDLGAAYSAKIGQLEKSIALTKDYAGLNKDISKIAADFNKLNKDANAIKNLQEYNDLLAKRARAEKVLERAAKKASGLNGVDLLEYDRALKAVEALDKQIDAFKNTLGGDIGGIDRFRTEFNNLFVNLSEEFANLQKSNPEILNNIFGDEEAVKRFAKLKTNELNDELNRAIATIQPGQDIFQLINAGDFPALKTFVAGLQALSGNSKDATKQIKELKLEMIDLKKATDGVLKLTDRQFQVVADNISKTASEAIYSFQQMNHEIGKTVDQLKATGQNFKLIDVNSQQLSKVVDAFDAIEERIFREIEVAKLQRTVFEALASDREKELKGALIPLQERYNTIQQSTLDLNSQILEQQRKRTISDEELNALIDARNKSLDDQEIAFLSIQKALGYLGIQISEIELKNQVAEVAKQLGKNLGDAADAAEVLNHVLGTQLNQNQQQIDSLETQLNYFRLMTKERRAVVDAQLRYLRVQQAIAKQSQTELEAQRSIAKENLSILKSAIDALEFGNEGVAKTLEIQNAKLDRQNQIYDFVHGSLLEVTKDVEKANKLTDDFVKGNVTLEQVVGFVKENYEKLGTNVELFENGLRSGLKAVEDINAETIKTLEIQREINKAISFVNNQADQYADKQKTVRDAIISVAEVLDDQPLIYKQQNALAADTLDLEKQKYQVLVQGLSALKGNSAELDNQIDQLLSSVSALSKQADLNNELFGKQLQTSIENARKELDKAREAAEGIADAIGGTLGGINNAIIDRYDTIFEKQREIKKQEEEIRLLQQQQIGLDETSDNYKKIADSIKDAQQNLSDLKFDLQDIRKESGIVRNAFTDLGKSISDLVIEIQVDQLKTALTKALTGTSLGLEITDAITRGSAQGANDFLIKIKQSLTELADANKNAILDSGQVFVNAISEAFNRGSVTLYERITEALGASINALDNVSPSSLVPNLRTASANQSLTNAFNSGQLITGPFGFPIEVKDPIKRTAQYAQEQNQILNGIKASIQLLSSSIITNSIAANGGNPLGASIGSTLGGSIGGRIAEKAFAETIGGAIGSAILPGVGTVLGGLLGGLIGGNQKRTTDTNRPIILPDLEDNTDKLKENTDALRALSAEFNDLRYELINAPARFVAPALPGLGLSQGPGVSGSTGSTGGGGGSAASAPTAGFTGGGLSLNFYNYGGNDQAFVDKVVKEVEKVYAKQQRLQGNNRKLF